MTNTNAATTNNADVTGYVLHESSDVVVIATLETTNPKTGDMIQLWILPRNVNPSVALKTGDDSLVCFDCKMRPQLQADGTRKQGACYVLVHNAPNGIWKAYQRGRYPFLAMGDYSAVFSARKVRFGAYGDPVLIPVEIMGAIASLSDGWTGYTHQWARPEFQAYSAFLMASVDTPAEYATAKSMEWRTFRTRTEEQAIGAREISCPASDEAGKRTTCERCKLCSGTFANDARKDITILAHGSKAKNFVRLSSLLAAAI